MSLTLGEKLRQAREAKGIKIGEVAEQTRISPLYIESIENDDYRALPGGIFNRGFVKSFAKYVGVDEQEALADYARLLYEIEGDVENVKFHRPEVLTDDRTSSSMLPTLIVAAVILGIMTVGVLFALRQFQSSEPSSTYSTPKTAANSTDTNSSIETESPPIPQVAAPDMATVKVDFTATSQPVALTVTMDGKVTSKTVAPGSTTTFEPKETIKFSYSRWVSEFAQMELNGKKIILPTSPSNPKRGIIVFEINKENLSQIWTSGEITPEADTVNQAANSKTESPANIAPPPGQNVAAPSRPSISPNTAQKFPIANRITGTPKPAGTSKTPVSPRPPGNTR